MVNEGENQSNTQVVIFNSRWRLIGFTQRREGNAAKDAKNFI